MTDLAVKYSKETFDDEMNKIQSIFNVLREASQLDLSKKKKADLRKQKIISILQVEADFDYHKHPLHVEALKIFNASISPVLKKQKPDLRNYPDLCELKYLFNLLKMNLLEQAKAEFASKILGLQQFKDLEEIARHPNFEVSPQILEWRETAKKLPQLALLYKEHYKKLEGMLWRADAIPEDYLNFLLNEIHLPKDEVLTIIEGLKNKIKKVKEEIQEDKHSKQR